MGIPNLISTLEPFASRAVIESEDAVVDGPALSYHVLHICRRNGVSMPSNKLLGTTAIAWLDACAARGLTM